MLYLISGNNYKPSVLEANKDEQYHIDYSRYCIAASNTNLRTDFINRYLLNKNFYKNNQWHKKEDIETFLMDSTGQQRNRIKMTKNIIRPMMEQFRGNIIRMNFAARARSISKNAITRREQSLGKMLFYTDLAKEVPRFSDFLKNKYPIGEDELGTTQKHDNIYVDEYVEAMNDLIRKVSEDNDFDEKKKRICEDYVLSGIARVFNWEGQGRQVFEMVNPYYSYWDQSGNDPTLRDAAHQGHYWMGTSAEIFERWPDTDPDYKKAIENYCQLIQPAMTWNDLFHKQMGKAPVFFTFWYDIEKCKFGTVIDEFGEAVTAKIGPEKEDDPSYTGYTEKDVVPPVTDRQKKIFKKKDTKIVDNSVIRYSIMIPREVVAYGADSAKMDARNMGDLVLEYGIMPYQPKTADNPWETEMPYSNYCWYYDNGDVSSPVDDAIDPQRLINRILSVAENQINNSRGSGTVYDHDMVLDAYDGENAEAEFLRDINESKPVKVSAKGKGVQNVIGTYDNSIGAGTFKLFGIVSEIDQMSQATQGQNEAMRGESLGGEQLVGVTELMIQRGSLMQEPVYYGIAKILTNMCQQIASRGIKIYKENFEELVVSVGTEGAKVLGLAQMKGIESESMRVFVKRSTIDEIQQAANNSLMLQLRGMGLLTDDEIAQLFNNATGDDISRFMKKAVADKKELTRKMQEEQSKAVAQAGLDAAQGAQVQASEQQGMMAREDANLERDRESGMDKVVLQGVIDKVNQPPLPPPPESSPAQPPV